MSTPLVETENLRHEPGEDPRALRTLTLRFPEWRPWYGPGRWWALSPARYRQRVGLVEADTPAELAARIGHIEDFHPHPEAPDRDTQVTVSDQNNEITGKGGDRDDRATAVRPRRRAR
ncbi:hypothetical protein ACFQVD_36075 [Streptosporangium amethystogenes subsp. fukuiense]|uniref:Uncharacterized protein n=1 Tax=Streptosporangium amethystogenes subsp. fukuiense TaxID=698418 RepID=A0ABW2TBT2_9ACTN